MRSVGRGGGRRGPLAMQTLSLTQRPIDRAINRCEERTRLYLDVVAPLIADKLQKLLIVGDQCKRCLVAFIITSENNDSGKVMFVVTRTYTHEVVLIAVRFLLRPLI
jgi:hypothetical protein